MIGLAIGLGARARAAPDGVRPPPDVAAGEAYDGRVHGRDPRDDAYLFPRLLLAVPRMLWRLAFWPIGAGARFIERTRIVTVLENALTSEDRLIGVRPVFNWISGFRATFGLSFFDEKLLGRGTDFRLSAASDYQKIVSAGFLARPTHAGRALEYTLAGFYNRRDDYLFTGVGLPAEQSHPGSRYSVDEIELHNYYSAVLERHVSLQLDGALGFRRFGNGSTVGGDRPINEVFCPQLPSGRCVAFVVDPKQVPGFYTGTQFLRAALNLRFDTRDSLFRPTSGFVIDLGADYSHGFGDDQSSYFRTHASIVAVINLWRGSRTLLLRATTNALFPVTDAVIPFSELIVIGGPDDLRGARWGEFRDYSSVLFTAEYRWPIWMWMDAALFVDYGGITGRNYSAFDFSELTPAIGLGIRLRTSSKFFLRFQFAYGFDQGWHASISATTDPL
jgi:outer membrane protein assembly factor BamA